MILLRKRRWNAKWKTSAEAPKEEMDGESNGLRREGLPHSTPDLPKWNRLCQHPDPAMLRDNVALGEKRLNGFRVSSISANSRGQSKDREPPPSPDVMKKKVKKKEPDYTTIDSVNLALQAKTPAAKAWWWLVTLVLVVGLIVAIGFLIQKYADRRTTIITRIVPNRGTFPAVTFCNMNPYKKSKLDTIPDVKQLVETYRQFSNRSKVELTTLSPAMRKKRQITLAPETMVVSFGTDAGNSALVGTAGQALTQSTSTTQFAPSSPTSSAARESEPSDQGAIKGQSAQGSPIPSHSQSTENPSATRPASIRDVSLVDEQTDWSSSVPTPPPLINRMKRNGSARPAAVVSSTNDQSGNANTRSRLANEDFMTNQPLNAGASSANSQGGDNNRLSNEDPMRRQSPTGSANPTTANGEGQTDAVARSATKDRSSDAMQSLISSNDQTDVTPTLNWGAITDNPCNSVECQLWNSRKDDIAMTTLSQDMLPYIARGYSDDLLIGAGYSADDVIIRCQYNGKRCYAHEFKLNVDMNYGNCYTFNAEGNYPVAERAGIEKGLTVGYMVGTGEYLDFIQTSGVRVVVHGQDESIFPDQFAMDIPTGLQISTGIHKDVVHAMNTSRRQCTKSKKEGKYFNYENESYSTELQGCLRSCYQEGVIEQCQCGDPRVPLPPHTSYDFCKVGFQQCVNSYYAVNESQGCGCHPPCDMENHSGTQSTARWAPYQAQNAREYMGNIKSNSTDAGQLSLITIYYEELVIVQYIETDSYDMWNLLWDISSVTGLLLSMSILSAVEVVNLGAYLTRKLNR